MALFNSLRFRMTILMLLAVVPPILLAIFFAGFRAAQIIRQEASLNIASKVTDLAKSTTNWEDKNVLALRSLSIQPGIVSMDAQQQKPLLEKMVSVYTDIYGVNTILLDGTSIARSDNEKLKNYSDRKWFQGAVAGKEISRQTVIAKTGGKPALCLATPIRQESVLTSIAPTPAHSLANLSRSGSIVGVASFCTYLTNLTLEVGAVRLGETGYAFLVDENGRVLAHPEPKLVTGKELTDLSTYLPVKTVLQGNKNLFSFVDESGKEWLSQGRKLQNGWGVIILQQTQEVLQQEQQFWQLILIVATATVLSVGALTWLIATRLIQPISDLTVAATILSRGELNQTVTIARNDELGILAKAFNQMAEHLHSSFAHLEKINEELQLSLQQLKQAQSQVIQSEKMSSLGQLVAGVAHEINNPVNFVQGNIHHADQYTQELVNLLQLYQQHYSNPVSDIQKQMAAIDLDYLLEDLPKVMRSMKIGAERIREIVQSLRNFARLDEAEMKVVDIHDGIESTLMILQHRLKAQPNYLAIEVIQEYGQLPLLQCYPGQLNQVFMNLLSNAIDALEESNCGKFRETNLNNTIRIQTELVDKNWVTIRIKDTGIGMTPAVQNRMFDPFFTTKPIGKGTGLGLSISYQIISEKHGGNLDCITTLGQGTEFIIKIPIRQRFST